MANLSGTKFWHLDSLVRSFDRWVGVDASTTTSTTAILLFDWKVKKKFCRNYRGAPADLFLTLRSRRRRRRRRCSRSSSVACFAWSSSVCLWSATASGRWRLRICLIVKQIWLLSLMQCLYVLAFHKHNSLPLGQTQGFVSFHLRAPRSVCRFQCDQIGRFFALWATIKSICLQ